MDNRRRISAVCLLIVFLGGLCGAHAADSGLRSPFSGRPIQQVQDQETGNTTPTGVSEGQATTSDAMGSGEAPQTKLESIEQKTISVLIQTLRTIIDLLKQLIEMLKKFLVVKPAPQASEPAASPQVPDSTSEQAAVPVPSAEPAPEQSPVPDASVTPEPASEPAAESTDGSSVPPAPPEIRRGPSPAECEQMRLLILDGKIEAAAAMLDKGFDPNARIGDRGTPLHYAAEMGQKGIVELLLKRGADLGARGERNATPLHIAAATKNLEICRLMIAAGADVNITGCDGSSGSDRTPLHIATEMGASDIVKLLITSGANVNALDSLKQTPLHWAIISGQTEAAGILREHGGVTDPAKIPTPAPSSSSAP